MYAVFIRGCGQSFSYIESVVANIFYLPHFCSWFAVHCTSMNNTNTLISGDNKGHASYLMEQAMNKGSLPGQVQHTTTLLCRGWLTAFRKA